LDKSLPPLNVHCPDAAKDREYLYGQLLAYFDVHGDVGVPARVTCENQDARKPRQIGIS
jgi:hypothetical protein